MGRHGRPLLIDPTVEDPFEHLLLSLSSGWYRSLTEKGRQTIEVLNLNRHSLVKGRATAYVTVVLWLRQWPNAVAGKGFYSPDEIALRIRHQVFADVGQSMLRQVDLPGAAAVFSRNLDVMEILRDGQLRDALMR